LIQQKCEIRQVAARLYKQMLPNDKDKAVMHHLFDFEPSGDASVRDRLMNMLRDPHPECRGAAIALLERKPEVTNYLLGGRLSESAPHRRIDAAR
jgi:hypothetical protein